MHFKEYKTQMNKKFDFSVILVYCYHGSILYISQSGGVSISNIELQTIIIQSISKLLDRLADKTKTDEYRHYVKYHAHFLHPKAVMAQILAFNATYTKVTSSSTWEKLGRHTIPSPVSIKVKTANNQYVWMVDITQTQGKPPPVIYTNIAGTLDNYQSIYNCLMDYASKFGENQKDESWHSDTEQETIFTLIREVLKCQQIKNIALEMARYCVCQYLSIDTADFTLGYLLELMDCDESMEEVKQLTTQETAIKAATHLIMHLNSALPFLQDTSPLTMQNKPLALPIGGIAPQLLKVVQNFSDIVPDKHIDLNEVILSGYRDKKMYPIRQVVGAELFRQGWEVYLLSSSDSESVAENLGDIEMHTWYCGITDETWETIKQQTAEEIVTQATSILSQWDRVPAQKEGDKDTTINVKQGTMVKSQISPSGGYVIAEDEIDFDEIENATWLDTALSLFFDTTGYEHRHVPYFTNQNNVSINYNLCKINQLMLDYCATCMTITINRHKRNNVYNVILAVTDTYTVFSYTHISETLDKRRDMINAPKSIKRLFEEYLEKHHEKHKPKTGRPTPEEELARYSNKGAGNASDEMINNGIYDTDNLQIFHMIETYKEQTRHKPQPKRSHYLPSMAQVQKQRS